MKNLAGDKDCDFYIRTELTKAHIEIVEHAELAPHREVPALLTGKLGAFTFVRFWYYWVVDGPLPLAVAEELYADPNGVEDVRVAGHCGCPPPREWATKRGSERFVTSYHIDTQEGLNLFTAKLREHGLAGEGK